MMTLDEWWSNVIKEREAYMQLHTNYLFKLRPSHFYTGKLIAINDMHLVIKDAAAVEFAHTMHESLRTGELYQVDPFVSDLVVERRHLIYMTAWPHELPREQKPVPENLRT